MPSALRIDHRPDTPVLGFLSKSRIVAEPGFNRWLVPPAALAVHLCIGMAYGFSVFWLPLARAIGVTEPVPCGPDVGFFQELFVTGCDWRISTLGWMYTLFFVLLGSSAAVWGQWLERAGPRKAGVVSALCWCGGMLISALGVQLHQFWLMLLGSGVIGGIGLGIGYITPVSTLIKWFPDRRGMATGLAIMGFGGGAMVGSPLAAALMEHFDDARSVGVAPTFVTMALIYLAFMLAGAFSFRVPPHGWAPAGWQPPKPAAQAGLITQGHVHASRVWRIPQFWLLWIVLCMNVSAGIGVIGMSSPMLQEVFGGRLIGVDAPFTALDKTQLIAVASAAAGFTALLSIFNIGGRFAWATASDAIGRKRTFAVFFIVGALLYASLPRSAAAGAQLLFVATVCVIVSMYGGGFATVPAYLADLFGTQHVGAIHGRLLTAWATAGVLGPVIVNYMRDHQIARGVARAQVYDRTMFILMGMLLVGLLANLLIRPVHARHFMTDEELARERTQALPAEAPSTSPSTSPTATGIAGPTTAVRPTPTALVVLAWACVATPMAWAIVLTLRSAARFFQ